MFDLTVYISIPLAATYIHKPVSDAGEHPAPPGTGLPAHAESLHHLGEVGNNSLLAFFVFHL